MKSPERLAWEGILSLVGRDLQLAAELGFESECVKRLAALITARDEEVRIEERERCVSYLESECPYHRAKDSFDLPGILPRTYAANAKDGLWYSEPFTLAEAADGIRALPLCTNQRASEMSHIIFGLYKKDDAELGSTHEFWLDGLYETEEAALSVGKPWQQQRPIYRVIEVRPIQVKS